MQGITRSTGNLFRLTAALTLAFAAGSCSVVPDWADPTSWFGDDKAVAEDGGQAPDLAALPDKPDMAAARTKVAESLLADRNHAQYSGEALRAGSVDAAPPPPQLPATEETKTAAARPEPPVAPKPVAPEVQTDRSVTADPTGRAMAGTLPSVGAAAPQPAPAVAAAPAAPMHDAPVAVAGPLEGDAVPAGSQPEMTAEQTPPLRTPSPPPRATADAPMPAPMPAVPQNPSDAALGFQPSAAPALDPSVAEFVPAPIVQRYQQTATVTGEAPVVSSKPRKTRAQGGPEAMTGAVIANMNALEETAPPQAAANPYGTMPAAVVYFPGDRVSLSEAARAEVEKVADRFRDGGNRGFVRVVGHASSRTPDMPVKKHLEVIFKKSQDRANAVAQALIRAGVPAKNILVEAVGDSQPIYYESMPKGEEGNRRAEIFLQG